MKNLQIVESFSFENKINDCSVETSGSGEETLEAETSETESKFSSDEEQDESPGRPGTPPEDYVELVEVTESFKILTTLSLYWIQYTFAVSKQKRLVLDFMSPRKPLTMQCSQSLVLRLRLLVRK